MLVGCNLKQIVLLLISNVVFKMIVLTKQDILFRFITFWLPFWEYSLNTKFSVFGEKWPKCPPPPTIHPHIKHKPGAFLETCLVYLPSCPHLQSVQLSRSCPGRRCITSSAGQSSTSTGRIRISAENFKKIESAVWVNDSCLGRVSTTAVWV